MSSLSVSIDMCSYSTCYSACGWCFCIIIGVAWRRYGLLTVAHGSLMYVRHSTALVDVVPLSIFIARSLPCSRDSCEYIRRRALNCAWNDEYGM
jgi:hypothetical protein